MKPQRKWCNTFAEGSSFEFHVSCIPYRNANLPRKVFRNLSLNSFIHKDQYPCPLEKAVWGPVPSPPLGWTWTALMRLALNQAHTALKRGEIPVGAVVVADDGRILAAAHNQSVHQSDPAGHAEILALRAAGAAQNNYRLENCVLVATLEPCLMCAGAAVHARLSGLVYGASDLKTGAIDSCLNALELPFLNHRPWHMGGIAASECTALLQKFFKAVRNTVE